MYEGKAYANKRPKDQRPLGDYYSTPKSLVWVAREIIENEFLGRNILEPAAGENAISNELFKMGLNVDTNDLYSEWAEYKLNYLNNANSFFNGYKYVITNPPFSLWDEFVNKAKSHCDKFMFIGRLNYLSTVGRSSTGIWDGLKWVMPFNRYVDYQTPYRDDGLFHVGAMATAWFIWDMNYTDPSMMKILNVQGYAKLGQFKKKEQEK